MHVSILNLTFYKSTKTNQMDIFLNKNCRMIRAAEISGLFSHTIGVCVYASKETHIHFRYMNPIIKISHLVDGARTVGEFMDAPWWWWRQRPCPYPEFVSFNGPLESNQIFSLIRPRLLSPSFSSSSFWCFL